MVILETRIFTRRLVGLLTDEEYRALQVALARRPSLGAIIRGSGGLRKVRWIRPGRGKRGGVRVIYYWAVAEERILMLLIYAKGEQEELTPEQLQTLRQIVEDEHP